MSIKSTLEIRRNSDGVIAVHKDLWDWFDNYQHPDFIWSDGNFACDCNRSDFFAQALGLEEGTYDDGCGSEKYSVRVTGPDGAVLYEDFGT